jgi:acyl carrier protein
MDKIDTTLIDNTTKLKQLVSEVFLLDPSDVHLDLHRQEIDTWDSLGVVSLAVGVEQTFGYHMTADEATSLTGLRDVVMLLKSKSIIFDRNE